jgi:chemotaxis protein MotA
MGAVGLVVLFACVFGVYIVHGGDMAPVIKAAPWEFVPRFSARLLVPL